MNEELAAYITRLCELSGHATRIDDDLILVEPGEDFIYDAFTMRRGILCLRPRRKILIQRGRLRIRILRDLQEVRDHAFRCRHSCSSPAPTPQPPTGDRRSPRFFHRIPRTNRLPADKQNLPHSQNIHNLLARCPGASVVPDGHAQRGPAFSRPRTVGGWIRRPLSVLTHMLFHRFQPLMPEGWSARC